jgi:lysophospholipase L1-like esterase
MSFRSAVLLVLLSGVSSAHTSSSLATICAGFTGAGKNGDWVSFGRYRLENPSLKPDRSRVVFLGDSITEAWSEEAFISGNAHYVGRGIGGQTALQMLVRFRADVIALKPQLVHIMAGTNDIAGNFGPETDGEIEGAIQSMVELALANHIKVVLASIPPAADYEWHPGLKPVPRIRRLNDWIKSYARHSDVGYVDYWPALATENGAMKSNLSEDGVHPNSEGYKQMQSLAQAAIEAALGRK